MIAKLSEVATEVRGEEVGLGNLNDCNFPLSASDTSPSRGF